MRPIGHACVTENICFDCGGDLVDDGGTYSEYHYDDNTKAFAAPVCNYCRTIHDLVKEAPRMPLAFDKRLGQLKSKTTPVNYAVALWTKSEQREDVIIERRYVVNLDGSVVTCKTTCDARRRLQSFNSSGWEPHTLKRRYKTVLELLEAVDKALTSQDYGRLF